MAGTALQLPAVLQSQVLREIVSFVVKDLRPPIPSTWIPEYRDFSV
jgi:hypothetical protein